MTFKKFPNNSFERLQRLEVISSHSHSSHFKSFPREVSQRRARQAVMRQSELIKKTLKSTYGFGEGENTCLIYVLL